MSTSGGSDLALVKAATPSPSPMAKIDVDYLGSKFEMHASLSEEERRFYLKMYPSVDIVNQRRVHCTVCRQHLGTALAGENNIKMHPILRVTHCVKCHDFYNSGEFSKGEDGSELYCRWCGQGGEVYCCSTCPYVFCKSCIVKNLSKGVIVDIEQNEHWNCFNCTSKILWPLRAQHWALVNYIQSTKKALQSMQMSELEARRHMLKDNTSCCRLAKAKATSLSDSMESLESNTSKRSQGSSANSGKRALPPKASPGPATKRSKSSNDEVVCTPDLLSMLEPDCQLSMLPKPPGRQPGPASGITTTPRIVTVQQNYTGPSPSTSSSSNGTGPSTSMGAPRTSLPPPLVLSGSGIRYRQSSPSSVTSVRRTVVPNVVRNSGPVFHTINGFRVDLNSAAQQDSYRLPNGRLIQVKRQMPISNPPPVASPAPTAPIVLPPMNPGVVIRPRGPVPIGRPPMQGNAFGNNIGIYNPQTNQQQRAPQIVRINQNQATTPTPAQVQTPNVNGSAGSGQTLMITPVPGPPKTPSLVRHNFPNTTLGQARSQLQEQIFSAMDICTHLTGKVVSLTHSNAYNQVRNYLDLKELYIHMSYLMTYAIGRFKHLQEKCLVDMREMGFKNDANSLENGQLAAEKQASDDEDNEIEIVEPKTDTITIDSDNDDDTPSTSTQQKAMMKIVSVTSAAPKKEVIENQTDIDVAAFSSTILASLLEVDIHEGSGDPKAISPGQKKQPRKKTTNKPNPALLQLERQRMEELKRSDVKLKKKCVVKVRRAEDEFEVARQWMDRIRQRDQDAQGDAAKVPDTAEASPAKAPSEIDLEESVKNSPPNNDHQPMEIEVQLNTLAPKLQEKEITGKEKESEDLKLKESDKQPLPDDKNKDKPVKKEKIGEMLKTAIKIKISQKAQTGGEVKTEEKRLTEEREKAVTAEQNKAVGEEGQVDKAISENISEKDSPDEKKKESASQTEELAEKDKTEQKKKEDVVSEKKPVEKEKDLKSKTTLKKVARTEDIEEEDPDQESSKEKEPPASEKERAIDEKESTESYQSDEKDKKAPTKTVSEAPSEAAAPLEADPSQDADKVVPQESIFQNEELTKQDPAADLLEAMDTSTDNGKSLAGELVESMDVIELDEPPKELLDCGIDEVISMDGIELSCATEELMKALASSPSALTSENATLDATDLNADELIETLPLETTEPPEILLKEDDNGETGNSEAPIINSGENGGTDQEEAGEATAPEDVAATGHIQG
ncbi:hypothetical protein KR200_000227 [Drosophila serrata]|nr:hypothetical protein KR200_000227 [Drosophila serrata]